VEDIDFRMDVVAENSKKITKNKFERQNQLNPQCIQHCQI
jgi:hypothetical protein